MRDLIRAEWPWAVACLIEFAVVVGLIAAWTLKHTNGI